MSRRITKWEPDNFELETTSIWDFPERGSWATHDSDWRGNWSPYIPRNIILRYSQEGDWVLDQFAGGGTTLVEAELLNRNVIGSDVNDNALSRCYEKTAFDSGRKQGKVIIQNQDARNLEFVEDDSIDLICTHPPYADIIHYSEGMNIEEDLSNLGASDFLEQMKSVAAECYRVLKKGKYCAILIGDTRKNGHVVPLGFGLFNIFISAGFTSKEIIIKKQHNCTGTVSWLRNGSNNFLLLAHEYLFVFHKQ